VACIAPPRCVNTSISFAFCLHSLYLVLDPCSFGCADLLCILLHASMILYNDQAIALELRELGSLGGTSTKRPPIDLRRQFGVSGGSCTPRKLRVGHCFGALFAPPTGAVCVPLCNLQLELSLKSATFHLLRGRNLFCISAARGRIFRDCFNGFEFSS